MGSLFKTATKSAEKHFGEEGKGVMQSYSDSYLGGRRHEYAQASSLSEARRDVHEFEKRKSTLEGYESIAASNRAQGKDDWADEYDKKASRARRELGTAFERSERSSLSIQDQPEVYAELSGKVDLQREYVNQQREKDKAFKEASRREEAGDFARKQIGKIEERFGKSDDLKTMREERGAQGDSHAEDALGQQIYNLNASTRVQVDAMERLAKALLNSEDKDDQAKGFALHDLLQDREYEFKGRADKAMNDYGESNGGAVGGVVARGLKEIPLIGHALYKIAGAQVAKSVDGSTVGQWAQGAVNGLMGNRLTGALANSGMANAGAGIGTQVGGFIKGPAAAPLLIGMAGVAGLKWASSKAEKDVLNTRGARDEETGLGDLGNKIGTSSRLMDDVRETKQGGRNGRLRRDIENLRMNAGDYVNMVGSINAPGLDDPSRREGAVTGMRLSRAYGLDTLAVGSVAHQLALGDRQGLNGVDQKDQDGNVVGRSGGLNEDLTRFGMVLSEGIKKGVSSEETTKAVAGAIERSRSNGAGILAGAQRGDLMAQFLASSQSSNAHLQGQNGADFISGARDKVANAEGKDLAFLYRSTQGASGQELGLDKGQASTYDELLKVNQSGAMRYLQNNLTNEVFSKQNDHFLKAYGGNQATLAEGLRQTYGMEAGQSEVAALDIYKQQQAGKPVDNDYLNVLTGRTKQTTNEDPTKEFQGENNRYQAAGTQEIRLQDAKIQAQRLTIESELVNRNIDQSQDAGESWREAKRWGQTGSNAVNRQGDDPLSYKQSDREAPIKRAEGGPVYGPGSEQADGIAARLSPGEFVVKASAAKNNRQLLENINNERPLHFSGGGSVGASSSDKSDQALIDALQKLTDSLNRDRYQDILKPASASQPEQSWISNIMEGVTEGAKSLWSRITGGGGSANGTELSVDTSSGGAGANMAATALKALNDPNFVEASGRCSQFVREVAEAANKVPKGSYAGGQYFGDEARQTGELWQKRGWAKTPDELKNQGLQLRPGDNVFQTKGSGDHDGDGDDGHAGIISPDGKSVIENSTRGKGGKQITPLSEFGKIDLVGRWGGFGGAGQGGKAGSEVERFIQAISAQESGHDYGAVNSRTGALGKYQVMPQNLTGWGKQAGKKNVGWDYEALGRDITPQQYLKSPQLQEQIARHQLGKAQGKYGSEGAARWWYSNNAAPSDKRPNAGEPTPNEYASNVLRRMKGGPQSSAPQHSSMEIKVTGDIKLNGKADAQVTSAVSQSISNAVRTQMTQTSRVPINSARPG